MLSRHESGAFLSAIKYSLTMIPFTAVSVAVNHSHCGFSINAINSVAMISVNQSKNKIKTSPLQYINQQENHEPKQVDHMPKTGHGFDGYEINRMFF